MTVFRPLLPLCLMAFAVVPHASVQAQLFKKSHPAPQPSPLPMSHAAVMAAPSPGNPYASPGAMPLAPASLPETVVSSRPVYSPPSYQLPYEGYRYQRREGRSRGGLFSSNKPSDEMLQLLDVIRKRAEAISTFRLPYVFGGDHPNEGGLDCSGAMKFLLSDIGFRDMPRTSYEQYAWLRQARTLRHAKAIPEQMGGRKGIKPGDLIFWGGTYNSGHKVSHVMIYLGQGRDGTHYMFGARGKNKTGLNGSGVDIFKLGSGYQKGLIGFGALPGVS